ncbi:MAG TPA: winged helix-turn-helix domain-containing protein [Candidatus Dormibacteraeota bacterium]|nr:winged helix-turn-helix domain-containing protein [Candidatus Dormibacteraeota bacterium]
MTSVVQSDRLLEGENPTTMFKQDARHWIAVYRQMISFKDGLLGRIQTHVRTLPPAGRRDVMENDVGVLVMQLGRYQRRLEFWYARQWELEGLSIDESTRTIAYREQSIHLTRREYQLFVRLADRSPGYTSAAKLLTEAWHDSGLPEETIRTYIVRLRRKLTELGAPAQIVNRARRGYSLVFDDHSGARGYDSAT